MILNVKGYGSSSYQRGSANEIPDSSGIGLPSSSMMSMRQKVTSAASESTFAKGPMVAASNLGKTTLRTDPSYDNSGETTHGIAVEANHQSLSRNVVSMRDTWSAAAVQGTTLQSLLDAGDYGRFGSLGTRSK